MASTVQSTMEVTIPVECESSSSNYPEPIGEFTEEGRNIIKEKVTKYSEEAQKLKQKADHGSPRDARAPTSPMEIITISEEGESSQANDQMPIREFTQEELNTIMDHLKTCAEQAEKLKEEADRGSTSCIYRVLPRLKKMNADSFYEPNKVSIGPYYYSQREKDFQVAEDCKWKCLGSLLLRGKDLDMQINTYKRCLQKISQLEVAIRKCYFEEFEVSGIEFLEMMVVDACFIIEIVEVFGTGIKVDFGESLAAMGWMVPYFYRDFLLLANQIPFFVLEEIYVLTRGIPLEDSRSNLMHSALKFFMDRMKIFDFDIENFISTNNNQHQPLHLLDLVRSSFMPLATEREALVKRNPFIHCISYLRLAGIKVSQVKARSFLEVKFKRGVIEMPNIAIDDLMRYLLLNCVAFEQLHQRISNKHFTAYATFLDCLVNTEEDLKYLRESNVIDNYLADDSELARFINRAGKDLVFNADDSFYLKKLFEDVDKHYRGDLMWWFARFEKEFSEKPWLFISAGGVILLILATSFQAVMAFLAYKYKS